VLLLLKASSVWVLLFGMVLAMPNMCVMQQQCRLAHYINYFLSKEEAKDSVKRSMHSNTAVAPAKIW